MESLNFFAFEKEKKKEENWNDLEMEDYNEW